jgi:sugar O-acyltransferase (sialic acid O-acetyltransferase NeuD family)
MKLVIIGAGGHGREVAAIAQHQSLISKDFILQGFIDDREDLHHQFVDGIPVLGGWEWFHKTNCNDVRVVCAVGFPAVIAQLVERASLIDLRFANVISPSAQISPHATMGEGVIIFPNCVVSTKVSLGDHVLLNVASTISHDSKIGRYTTINPGAHIAGNVTIEEGCYIGMGANIIQGRTIGNWTTVGAGAVVIRDLPSQVTAVGIPAQVVKDKELTT